MIILEKKNNKKTLFDKICRKHLQLNKNKNKNNNNNTMSGFKFINI